MPARINLPAAQVPWLKDYNRNIEREIDRGDRVTVASTADSYTEGQLYGRKIVQVTASGKTVTLPPAATCAAVLTYKLMVAGTLTIDGDGSETIDGATTKVLNTQYQTATIVSDGTGWLVI